jgi:hypothetical protein
MKALGEVGKELDKTGEEVWETLKACGWIMPTEDSSEVLIVPKDQREMPELDNGLKLLQSTIEGLLDSFFIGSISTRAVFTGGQKLREGWLTLRGAIKPS